MMATSCETCLTQPVVAVFVWLLDWPLLFFLVAVKAGLVWTRVLHFDFEGEAR